MLSGYFTRGQFLGTMSAMAAASLAAPAYAWADGTHGALTPHPPNELGASVLDLEIQSVPLVINGRTGKAIGVNGSIPGPLVRLREGQALRFRRQRSLG